MRSYGTTGNGTIDHTSYSSYLDEIKPVEVDAEDRVYLEHEIEEIPHDPLAYARETLDSHIVQSDYFMEQALEKGIDIHNTSSTEYLKYLSDFTNAYLDQENVREYYTTEYDDETYHLIRLFGAAPYAIRQQRVLDTTKNTNHKRGMEIAKDTLINLNATIFQVAEANPKRKLSDLADYVDLSTSTYDPDARGYTKNVVMQNSLGIRKELAVWQSINFRRSPIYSIRHGNTNEEKHGIDYIIGVQDAELKVDIKSNLQQVIDAAFHHTPTKDEPFTKTADGQFVYCPQIREENFTHGTFELDTAEKIKLRNSLFEHFQKMIKLV